MLTARALWMARRSAGFASGSSLPFLTAIAISFETRVNCFARRSQRANIVTLRFSKMRPMAGGYRVRGSERGRSGARTPRGRPTPRVAGAPASGLLREAQHDLRRRVDGAGDD